MGTLRSTIDWSGREVAGIILGDPVVEEDGTFVWDHPSIPGDWIDDDGDVFAEVDDNA